MAHALADAGHRVTVISLAVNEETIAIDRGVEIHRIQSTPKLDGMRLLWRLSGFWPGFAWAAMRRMKTIHRDHPIDVVEAAEGRADSFFVGLLSRRPKLIVRLHTARIFIDRLNRVSNRQGSRRDYWLEKQAIARADLVTAPSQAMIDLTRTWLPLRDKQTVVVANPVNEREFRPSKSSKRSTVLYVGRLERRKGAETITQAMPIVLRKVPTAEFVFIGSDGPDHDGESWRDKLVAAVDPASRGRLRFEQIARAELCEAYQQAGVCILPSTWENFPYALLEAMACGTPVVATRTGGFSELVEDGVSGFLVPIGDAQALADRIVTILEDARLREAMANNARARVEKLFSVERVLAQMTAVYEAAKGGPQNECNELDDTLLSCQPR